MARHIRGLLDEAGETWDAWYTIEYSDSSDLRTQSEPEFLSHLRGAEPDEIKDFALGFGDYATLEGTKISIDCDRRWREDGDKASTRDTTAVSMRGENRMVVEGVFVQINEFVEKLLRRQVEAAQKAQEQPPPPDPVNLATVAASRAAKVEKSPRSWIHSPWTVTIVGGLIVLLVGAAILALVA